MDKDHFSQVKMGWYSLVFYSSKALIGFLCQLVKGAGNGELIGSLYCLTFELTLRIQFCFSNFYSRAKQSLMSSAHSLPAQSCSEQSIFTSPPFSSETSTTFSSSSGVNSSSLFLSTHVLKTKIFQYFFIFLF